MIILKILLQSLQDIKVCVNLLTAIEFERAYLGIILKLKYCKLDPILLWVFIYYLHDFLHVILLTFIFELKIF